MTQNQSALAILDRYIDYYTKLKHNGTVKKLKQIRIDIDKEKCGGEWIE